MKSISPLKLVLFTTDPAMARRAVAARIDALIVDWEWRGKERRQTGADTEINRDTPDHLAALRAIAPNRFCRLNRFGTWTPDEVELALENGATDLLLPMVEHPEEVEAFLRYLNGRARPGILVETLSACECAKELARFPLDWVYLGLNDLALQRRGSSLFEPLIDGTAEHLREIFESTAFGVAGLTVLEGGHPVPCRLLLAELARLSCDFTFLRRSFKRDSEEHDWASEVERWQQEWRRLRTRNDTDIERDRAEFESVIHRLPPLAFRSS